MASIRVDVHNVVSLLEAGQSLRIKLDAWRVTLKWTFTDPAAAVYLDGCKLGLLASNPLNASATASTSSDLVLGGAYVNGFPIMLDDELVLKVAAFTPSSDKDALLVIREYIVEGRPGPDKLISDEVRRNVSRPVNRPTDTGRPAVRERLAPGAVRRRG